MNFVLHAGMRETSNKFFLAVAALAIVYGLLWVSTYFLEQPFIMFTLGLVYGCGMVGFVATGTKNVEVGLPRPWQDKVGLVGCSIGSSGVVICALYLCWSIWGYSPYYARTPLIAAGMIYAPGGIVGMGLAALVAMYFDYRRVL
jgi:hypothetical protein